MTPHLTRRLLPLTLLLSVLLTASASGQPPALSTPAPTIQPNTIGHPSSLQNLARLGRPVAVSGDRIAYRVHEVTAGEDLNGDGDQLDEVLATVDVSQGAFRNLALAVNSSLYSVHGAAIVFQVDEASQGDDLDGDGLLTSSVLHILQLATGRVMNLGISSQSFGVFRFDGQHLVFRRDESATPATDHNGDGDTDDFVLFVYEIASGALRNLSLALSFDVREFFLEEARVAFAVSEAAQGNVDLNGDGDTQDGILHVHDIATATTSNIALPVDYLEASSDWISFATDEGDVGSDLNADGDTDDVVMHVHDARNGATINLEVSIGRPGLPYNRIVARKDRVAFRVDERGQQVDLNGDGDLLDRVAHVYHTETGRLTNVGIDADRFSLGNRTLAFWAYEPREGADLNGDGDLSDLVLHLYDFTAGTTQNLGFAAARLTAEAFHEDDFIVFHVDEALQGGVDFNGDGDGTDRVALLYDLRTGLPRNLGLAIVPEQQSLYLSVSTSSDRVVVMVDEASQGVDRNGDGTLVDRVPAVYDLGRDRITNLGVSADTRVFVGRLLAFSVSEHAEQRDLNGDGDRTDLAVLHVATLR